MISKKALSPIIAYVILIVIILSTSMIVYPWLRTYVPISPLACPDSVSVFLDQINCTKINSDYQINISIKNNGMFGVGGYFINFRDNEGKIIPWNTDYIVFHEIKEDSNLIIMSGELVQMDMKPGVKFENTNKVSTGEKSSGNPLDPDKTTESFFTLINKEVTSIELIPFREEGDKRIIVSCGHALITENVYCSDAI